MFNNKSNFRNTLERNDGFEELQHNPRINDEIETTKKENIKLEFILNKYNLILNEYQLKFGNELFNELDRQLNIDALDSVHNNMSEFKKILVDNVSLFKEYEKIILDKNKNLEFLNSELNRFQTETEKLVEENKSIREELDSAKEDLNKFYKSVLNDENKGERKSMTMSGGFHFSKSSNSNNNLNNDIQANIDLLKNQNEQLLQLIENTKYESEHHRSLFLNAKEKYENLQISNESLNSDFQNILKENEELFLTKNYIEKKIKENSNRMLINDKKTSDAIKSCCKFEIENKYYKQELDHYKEMYDELEKRKNSELNATMYELNELRNLVSDNGQKITFLEEANSEYKFDTNKLKGEIQIYKYDCDHMTKILEESNFAVKAAAEKEKHIDNVIKSHKRKVDEAIMEKEKVLVKLRLNEKQLNKINDDYSKLLSEKQSQYESFIDSAKERFNHILQNKEEEISDLKNDNLSIRIEKDKYQSEYSTMKKELDKFSFIFREENEKYMRKYEESEKTSNRMQNHLHDKINILARKCDKLEFEKNNIENELNMLKSTDKSREALIQNFTKNDDVISADYNKIKQKCEILEKEKDFNLKEIKRITNLYEIKLEQLKEHSQLRITVLDNTMKAQKDDFSVTEEKAFDMLKKQENITNKFKEEFRKTVDYYENVIERVMKDNRALQKQNDIENDNFNNEQDNNNNNNDEYEENI